MAVSPSYFRIIPIPLSSSGLEPDVLEISMFIETEVTPNPATLKFLPGRPVMTLRNIGHSEVRRAPASRRSRGPCSRSTASPVCFLAPTSFRSRNPAATGRSSNLSSSAPSWSIFSRASRCLTARPALAAQGGGQADSEEFFAASDADTVAAIKKLIETHVRPAVANDGGDIKFRGFRDGTVYVAMKGSCSGCPSSTATLRHGIQNLLKHFVPDVQAVEQI